MNCTCLLYVQRNTKLSFFIKISSASRSPVNIVESLLCGTGIVTQFFVPERTLRHLLQTVFNRFDSSLSCPCTERSRARAHCSAVDVKFFRSFFYFLFGPVNVILLWRKRRGCHTSRTAWNFCENWRRHEWMKMSLEPSRDKVTVWVEQTTFKRPYHLLNAPFHRYRRVR